MRERFRQLGGTLEIESSAIWNPRERGPQGSINHAISGTFEAPRLGPPRLPRGRAALQEPLVEEILPGTKLAGEFSTN